ncbi:RNA 2',3'-cyclic phosphodiesterase [candidate division KSB3 bacterium]|uniref:RNA 2',3'-cyclic phosphodiesterase n=1 Tax=candidate division KSB3 bacterium TaxID=2044937 RepID=A0A2G6E9X6_9BACT|nr:MAG: RNA 2',3'-cyclic phosphodiesterase [candidate division KSB3 bacterium]PIE30950.1 MAG: RNA 2',3'-cyclic phosphodiesterase [candidate division KSB3 bacterium]
MAVIRSFIAIKIPGDIQEKLQAIQDKLKQSEAHVSWTAPENIHLTLQFLGNIEEKQLDELVSAILSSVQDLAPFQLQIGYAGAFPNIRFPRVIWIGVTDDDSGSLKTLQSSVSGGLAQLGFDMERERFQPHLTLGRVRSQKNHSTLLRAIESMVNVWVGELSVRSIFLLKSELRPRGPEYTVLSEIRL